ncbi:MAG: hypothetical protein SPD11_05655 [Sphaerochaetaceae bacterium]|nr:hypothetical protein [Sphaerochaetaceae bacterium]
MKSAVYTVSMIMMLFLGSTFLFAGGDTESGVWYVPSENVASGYFDLGQTVSVPSYDNANFSSWNIGQVGSSLGSDVSVTIQDALNSDGFYFSHISNPTMKRAFFVRAFRTRTSRDWFGNTFTHDHTNSAANSGNGNSLAMVLPKASYRTGGNVSEYYYIDFAMELGPPPADLEAGIYEAQMLVSIGTSSYILLIRGQYATSEEYFTGASLIVTPTAAANTFNIREYAGNYQKIVDVHFETHTMGGSNTTYNANSFRVGVSPSGVWQEYINDPPYIFVRDGSQNQTQNQYNSVAYDVQFAKTGGSSISTENPPDSSYPYRLAQPATWDIQNASTVSSLFGGTSVYTNSYSFNGEVSIKVPSDKVQDLAGGVYRTNIYFYVISNV